MALAVLPGTAVAVLQMPRAPQIPRVGRLGGLFGAPCIPRSLPPDQPVSIRSLTPGHPQSGQWQLGYQCISVQARSVFACLAGSRTLQNRLTYRG